MTSLHCNVHSHARLRMFCLLPSVQAQPDQNYSFQPEIRPLPASYGGATRHIVDGPFEERVARWKQQREEATRLKRKEREESMVRRCGACGAAAGAHPSCVSGAHCRLRAVPSNPRSTTTAASPQSAHVASQPCR